MAMLVVKVPSSASPGTQVPVVICGNKIAGLACQFEVEAWWTEGTDAAAFERLDNPSQCHYLGKKTFTLGQCVSFGSYTQPSNGSYIRFKITQIPPTTAVSGIQKCPSMTYYLDWKVTTGGLAYPNVQFNVSANPTTVKAGGTVQVYESVRILNDSSKHTFRLVLKTPFGTTYATSGVQEVGYLGDSATFQVKIPASYAGRATFTAEAYADGKLIARKTVSVNVVGTGSIPVKDALMSEVKKWYKKTVQVPGAEGYDWSYDVTQTVRQVISNVSKAYLYGQYYIIRYAYAGQNKPPKRTAQEKVSEWRQGREVALIYLGPKEYPNLAGKYGWYWVWLPAKLKLYYTSSAPSQNVPVMEQKTGPLSGWWPLLVGAGILLWLDRTGRHP